MVSNRAALGLLIVLVCAGCMRYSDGNQAPSQTAYYLNRWGDYIKTCHAARLPIEKCATLDESLEFLKKHKLLETSIDEQFLRHDGRNNEFVWSSVKKENGTLVVVTSHGPNGTVGTGRDDNHRIEIFIPDAGEVTTKITSWDRKGVGSH